MHKQRVNGDDLCPSQLKSLAEDWLEPRGKWMVSCVSRVREE